MGAVVFVGLTGVAIWHLATGEMWRAAGWFTNAILACLLFYGTIYLQMTFRSTNDFVKLARANVVEGIAGLVGLVLVAFTGLLWLFASILARAATSTPILYRGVRSGWGPAGTGRT